MKRGLFVLGVVLVGGSAVRADETIAYKNLGGDNYQKLSNSVKRSAEKPFVPKRFAGRFQHLYRELDANPNATAYTTSPRNTPGNELHIGGDYGPLGKTDIKGERTVTQNLTYQGLRALGYQLTNEHKNGETRTLERKSYPLVTGQSLETATLTRNWIGADGVPREIPDGGRKKYYLVTKGKRTEIAPSDVGKYTPLMGEPRPEALK